MNEWMEWARLRREFEAKCTDGWIPIIEGKLPIEVKSGDHLRYANGAIVECLSNWCKDRKVRSDLVAIRPSQQPAQTIMRSQILDPTSWNVSPDFHVESIESDKLFDRLMASCEAKRKSLRDARARRTIVPPIGMTAMMKIAGKAMED